MALYAGDDATDLDAFRGLRALVDAGDLQAAVCVAVASDEAPEEMAAEADLVIDGTTGIRELLEGSAGVSPCGSPTFSELPSC